MKKVTLLLLCTVLVQFSFGQTINWSYNLGAGINPQVPAIANDGTIYIGSEDNANFHAINPDGTLKWVYAQLTDNVYSSASIASDGTIYVGAKDSYIHAINPDGSQKWTFLMAGDPILASPAISNNGTIYSGCDGDIMYAINPDGTEKWKFTTAGFNIRSTPAVAADGTVYIASDDDNVYALNPADGTVNWSYPVGGDVEGCISIDTDGTIFLGVDEGTPNGSVFAINPNGTLKWQSVNTGRVLSSPAIANGFVYFGTKDTNKLYALNATTGVEAWSYTAGDIILSSPAVGDDGKIYFGSFDDKLYCLNSDGTLNFDLELSVGNNIWSSPAIKNGNLFIGSYDGSLYSIDIPSTDLASSNWPMFGKNLQHTSSADVSLGITDFNSKHGQSLKVFYENGELNIKIEEFNGIAKVALFDMLGRNVKSQTLAFGSNNFEKIRLENVKSGIYIVNIQTENNSVIGSIKFIINN
jgi:outer membrane protein assembly factor BamB